MKIGRNDPCHCGSGKKYKHCCYAKDSVKHETADLEVEADTGSAAEEDAAREDQHNAPADGKREHNPGRGRFHGSARGGSGSFSPRVFRGSQRGS